MRQGARHEARERVGRAAAILDVMDTNAQKKAAAEAALQFIDDDMTVGVGTGSTVNFFIDALASKRARIKAAVASSEASAKRLRALQIPVSELNDTDGCDIYVDGVSAELRRFLRPPRRLRCERRAGIAAGRARRASRSREDETRENRGPERGAHENEPAPSHARIILRVTSLGKSPARTRSERGFPASDALDRVRRKV